MTIDNLDFSLAYARKKIIHREHFGMLALVNTGVVQGVDALALVNARVTGFGDIGPSSRRVEVVAIPILSDSLRLGAFAKEVFGHSDLHDNVTYIVNASGVGREICLDLEARGCSVVRAQMANPCFLIRNNARYKNLREQGHHQTALALQAGRLAILCDNYKSSVLASPNQPNQTTLSSILWGALSLAFLETATYQDNEG